MEEIILKAMARSGSPKQARHAGFIPGVLNAHDTTSTAIQFEAAALNKIIAKHGTNAKIWVEIDTEKKFGFIKEVQYHPVEGKVIHVSIQMISKDQDVKMQLPINYHGRDILEAKLLQLQIYKSEIEVIGKAETMPDAISVDISKRELGETITAGDLKLPPELKNLDPEHEIYAVIKAKREEAVAEEPEKAAPAE